MQEKHLSNKRKTRELMNRQAKATDDSICIIIINFDNSAGRYWAIVLYVQIM